MAKTGKKPRDFEVYTLHPKGAVPRMVVETSLEAAAVAYVEEVGLALHPDDHQLAVYVRDLSGGHEHCFTVDVETGSAAPCK